MKEIWKDIEEYKGLYQVSNLGRVKRILFRNNNVVKEKETILKENVTIRNRTLVHLYKNDIRKAKSVHRLVATAFLDNKENYPEVNHIDGNPRNNNVENLEWCSKSYNARHAYINNLSKLKNYNEKAMKPIIRSDGKIYRNSYDASKDLKVSVCSIRDVLKGRIKTCKGYKFNYLSKEWGSEN